ncbi:hypothetical protein SAMN06296058_1241 [Pseudoxanthomonas indica]|uniref:Uncharacterized protein n=2 Tax=Pseudoxanthomonas indica TaxID=428993 RepID=A0A1T5K0L0_9GAMM|nr:hypothetical protein SAMN06296058_1241 [Pseudoxanthomonas indica]
MTMTSIPTAPDVRVTAAHLRSIPHYTTRRGFCVSGARAWFQRHGLDFRAFVRDGIPASQLEATGCGLGAALANWARQEVAHGR